MINSVLIIVACIYIRGWDFAEHGCHSSHIKAYLEFLKQLGIVDSYNFNRTVKGRPRSLDIGYLLKPQKERKTFLVQGASTTNPDLRNWVAKKTGVRPKKVSENYKNAAEQLRKLKFTDDDDAEAHKTSHCAGLIWAGNKQPNILRDPGLKKAKEVTLKNCAEVFVPVFIEVFAIQFVEIFFSMHASEIVAGLKEVPIFDPALVACSEKRSDKSVATVTQDDDDSVTTTGSFKALGLLSDHEFEATTVTAADDDDDDDSDYLAEEDEVAEDQQEVCRYKRRRTIDIEGKK